MTENEKAGITAVVKAESTGGLLSIGIIVSLGLFIVGFDSEIFLFGGAFIDKITSINPSTLGIMATAYTLGIVIFSLAGGYIFDKITTRNGIMFSLGVLSLFSALIGLAKTETELFIFRFLTGVGTGMVQPMIASFLGDLRSVHRGKLIALVSIMFNAGIASAPYVFSGFSSSSSFFWPFVISGIMGAVLIVLVAAFVPPVYVFKKHSFKGIVEILNKPLLLISFSILFFGIAYFAFLSYFTPYMLSLHYTKPTITAVTSALGFGGIAFALPAGWGGDMFKRVRIIQLGATMMVIGTLLITVLHLTILIAVLGLVLFGGGYAVFGQIRAFTQETVELAWVGTAVGFMEALYNVGGMVGGPLMSSLVSHGYQTAGLIAIVIPMIVCLVIAIVTPSVPKRVWRPEGEVQVTKT
jgi:MFS family permease